MRHALITGGSRGIGAAAVRAFTAAGYAVSFFYEKNDAAAAAVSAETGAEAVRCDVADAQAVLDAVSCLPETDVLVNNAGICHYGLLSQITQAQWDRLFAVNVGGIYHCVNAVLPAMLRRQSGCIINVSSMWGQVGASCEACYSATKGAVLALTKALAHGHGRKRRTGGARGAGTGGPARQKRHAGGRGAGYGLPRRGRVRHGPEPARERRLRALRKL